MKFAMNDFDKNRIVNFVFVLIVSIWGLALKKFDFSDSNRTLFQRLIIETVAPIQEGFTSTKGFFQTLADNYLYIVNTRKENKVLKKQIEDLNEIIFQYEGVKKENNRLKELLKFGEEIKYEKVLAQVIGWDSSGEFQTLRINKGLNDGIVRKSAVITSQGLVGIVQSVSANYSDIITILDFNNKVDVILDRTRAHGILQGNANQICNLNYVVRSESVEIGDVVITSGLGTIYPKGIRIGTVVDVENSKYALTQDILVKPFVDFNKIEEVVVLTTSMNTGGEKMDVDGEKK
ncbi:MAG: rod shape-determining protein MreC [Halobacteriovoraceae bacterium]|nr:rod shape-determining protein MreC [Halobacteriovoraceae bacterium]